MGGGRVIRGTYAPSGGVNALQLAIRNDPEVTIRFICIVVKLSFRIFLDSLIFLGNVGIALVVPVSRRRSRGRSWHAG